MAPKIWGAIKLGSPIFGCSHICIADKTLSRNAVEFVQARVVTGRAATERVAGI